MLGDAEEEPMAWIAYALPVLPGQADRLENWAEELAPHMDDYLILNEQGTVKRHYEWLQRGPNGDLRLTVFEVDDAEALSREFEDTTYDRFWRQHVRELHGFDPQAVEEGGFPVMIHSYEAD